MEGSVSTSAAGPQGQEQDRSHWAGGGWAQRDTNTLEVRKALREGGMGRKEKPGQGTERERDDKEKSHWVSLRGICFLAGRGRWCSLTLGSSQCAGAFKVKLDGPWLGATSLEWFLPRSNDIRTRMMDSTWCHRLGLPAMWLSGSAELKFVEGSSERTARDICLLNVRHPLSTHTSRWTKP